LSATSSQLDKYGYSRHPFQDPKAIFVAYHRLRYILDNPLKVNQCAANEACLGFLMFYWGLQEGFKGEEDRDYTILSVEKIGKPVIRHRTC